MAIDRFLDRMCLALWDSGLWLRYATLQNLIPFSLWAPTPFHPGTIQGRKGSNFAIWQPCDGYILHAKEHNFGFGGGGLEEPEEKEDHHHQ